MAAGVTYSYGAEFKADLQGLTQALIEDVRGVIDRVARDAAANVARQYPARTTKKQKRSRFDPLATTVLIVNRDRLGDAFLRTIVKPGSALGFWYEDGTPERITKRGFSRGAMPARPLFALEQVKGQAVIDAAVRAALEHANFIVEAA